MEREDDRLRDLPLQVRVGPRGRLVPDRLANNKQYISFYICAADEEGYLAEQNADRLGKVRVGKSCIRFNRLEVANAVS